MTTPVRTTGITGKLARASARHPWKTVAAWIIVLVVGLATMATIGNRFTMNEEFRIDLESRVADDLITQRLNGGAEDPAQERVIVSSTDLTVDDPAFEAVVANVASAIGAHEEVARVETYYDTEQDALVSFDRHRTVIVTTLAGDPVDAVQDAQPVIRDDPRAADSRARLLGPDPRYRQRGGDHQPRPPKKAWPRANRSVSSSR